MLSGISSLKRCLKIKVLPWWFVHRWVWPQASGQGSTAQKCCLGCVLCSSQSASLMTFLAPVSFVFGLGIHVCHRMDHPVFYPSWRQIALHPYHHPGFLTSMCSCVRHLLPGVHSSHPASQAHPNSSIRSVPEFSPFTPSLRTKAGGSLLWWHKNDLWGLTTEVKSWLCHLLTGETWSVIELPCLTLSVCNFHLLRTLQGINVAADIQGLVQGLGSRNLNVLFHSILWRPLTLHLPVLAARSYSLLSYIRAFIYTFYLTFHMKPKCTRPCWAALYAFSTCPPISLIKPNQQTR